VVPLGIPGLCACSLMRDIDSSQRAPSAGRALRALARAQEDYRFAHGSYAQDATALRFAKTDLPPGSVPEVIVASKVRYHMRLYLQSRDSVRCEVWGEAPRSNGQDSSARFRVDCRSPNDQGPP